VQAGYSSIELITVSLGEEVEQRACCYTIFLIKKDMNIATEAGRASKLTKVSSTTHLNGPAEKVWELIGQFKSVADWHPAAE